MTENNRSILTDLEGQQIQIDDLIKRGFKDKRIIAGDTRQMNSPFLGKIIYHGTTYFRQFTLEIFNDKVKIKCNNLSDAEAGLLNEIRDLRKTIESLGDSIWANRFEFDDQQAANDLEREREEYQKILDDYIQLKEKYQIAD